MAENTSDTLSRNLHKFLAQNYDTSSYKLLYKVAQNTAAFYLEQETCARNTCTRTCHFIYLTLSNRSVLVRWTVKRLNY